MPDNVNIIIAVKDLATATNKKIEKSFGSLEKAVESTSKNTTRAEKDAARATKEAERERQKALKESEKQLASLYQSTKFLYSGSLTKGAIGSIASISAFHFTEVAAQSDELRISFEKTFGQGSGSLLNNVRNSVKGIVDDTTLMKNAIQANIAGIKDMSILPDLFKMGAVASQRLGFDASESIELARKAVVEFNEGAMEQLGIINKLDPAYKTQLAMIEKTTKGLGAYMSTAQKLAYVQDQMRKRFGQIDVMEDNLQAFRFLSASLINLKNNFLYLVGDALAPFMRGFALATTEVVKFIQHIRNDAAMKAGAMAIIKFTLALSGMLTALTAIKLAFLGLSLVFSGPFGVIGGVIALFSAFKMATGGLKGFQENMEYLGKIVGGVFQMLSSFDEKTGTVKIGKDLAKALGPNTLGMMVDGVKELVEVFITLRNVIHDIYTLIKPLLSLIHPLLKGAVDTAYVVSGLSYEGQKSGGVSKRVSEVLKGGNVKYRPSLNPFDQFQREDQEPTKPTATAQTSLGESPVPQIVPVAQTANTSAQNNEDLKRLLMNTNNLLQSIDSKTGRKNVFEDKIIGSPGR